MAWTLIFDLDKLSKGQNFGNITIMENLPKYAWILCVRHNLLLAELCAVQARCIWFQMLSIILSTPSGSFKADRLYLFLNPCYTLVLLLSSSLFALLLLSSREDYVFIGIGLSICLSVSKITQKVMDGF